MKLKIEIEVNSEFALILDGLLERLEEAAEDYLSKQNKGSDFKLSVNEVVDPFEIN